MQAYTLNGIPREFLPPSLRAFDPGAQVLLRALSPSLSLSLSLSSLSLSLSLLRSLSLSHAYLNKWNACPSLRAFDTGAQVIIP